VDVLDHIFDTDLERVKFVQFSLKIFVISNRVEMGAISGTEFESSRGIQTSFTVLDIHENFLLSEKFDIMSDKFLVVVLSSQIASDQKFSVQSRNLHEVLIFEDEEVHGLSDQISTES